VSVLAILLGLTAAQGFAADSYKITTYAGNGDAGYSGDGGPATGATFSLVGGVYQDMCFDSRDNLFIIDRGRIRKIDTFGVITTVAGNGKRALAYSGEGGPAIEATIAYLEGIRSPLGPTGIYVDAAGNIYIAGFYFDLFWKIDTAGIITTVGGEGKKPPNEWKEETSMEPRAWKVSGDQAGSICFLQYNWAKKVDKAGAVTSFTLPVTTYDFSFDKSGNLYMCATGENRVYKMDASGKTIPVAGTGQIWGEGDARWYSGDGGPALEASLKDPTSIAVDSAGNLYIADTGNKAIRKVDTRGIISSIAGGGFFTARSSEGGPATAISLVQPTAIRINSKGDVFFCDPGSNAPRIFRLYR
jgi:hypothetical protein